MKSLEDRIDRLIDRIAEEYDEVKAAHARQLLSDLATAGVGGFEKYVKKLERALGTGSEFAGTLREGVYARFFSRAAGKPAFEPKGTKGPDLALVAGGAYANVEIKRLLDGETLRPAEDLEEWYRDETDDEFDPGGNDRWTDKVRGVITDAASQLVPGEPNLVIISDWSVSVTRGNFRRAIELLFLEAVENGTYGSISAVQYDANYLGPTNTFLWINHEADIALPEDVIGVLQAAARDKREAANDVLRRALHHED